MSLDAAANYNAARADPDAFVRQSDDLLVIDEVQRVPGLIRAMKDAVEKDRRPGRFLITGSANLLEIPGTEESLAGRAETVVLYGLSQGELTGRRENFTDRLLAGDGKTLGTRTGTLKRQDYLEIACAGSYPEPLKRRGRRRNAWFDNYIGRIMTRDVQDLSRLTHLDRLPDLMRLLAANTSGELVKARFAQDSGIPESSLPPYLDLLETLYLIHQLPAWGDNLNKRVTGRPKVSVLDTGLAARLNHVTPAAMAPGSVSDAAGGLLESFVAAELRRQLVWADTPARLFHFRDRNGLEVDIVLESDDRRVAGLEMKAAGSVSTGDFKGLRFLRDKLKPLLPWRRTPHRNRSGPVRRPALGTSVLRVVDLTAWRLVVGTNIPEQMGPCRARPGRPTGAQIAEGQFGLPRLGLSRNPLARSVVLTRCRDLKPARVVSEGKLWGGSEDAGLIAWYVPLVLAYLALGVWLGVRILRSIRLGRADLRRPRDEALVDEDTGERDGADLT